jgi:hypothetical protein
MFIASNGASCVAFMKHLIAQLLREGKLMATHAGISKSVGKRPNAPLILKTGSNVGRSRARFAGERDRGGYDKKIKDCRGKCDYYQGVISGAVPVTR